MGSRPPVYRQWIRVQGKISPGKHSSPCCLYMSISYIRGQHLGISCDHSEPSLPWPFLMVFPDQGWLYGEGRPKPINMLELEGVGDWLRSPLTPQPRTSPQCLGSIKQVAQASSTPSGACTHAGNGGPAAPTWDVKVLGSLVRGWSGGPHI